jgi:hypothetical protein
MGLASNVDCRETEIPVAREKELWTSLQEILGATRRIKWICMLKAYLDETGIHDSKNSCIIAGFLGNEDQWARFDEEWKKGLGKRERLHMKDLQWSKPDRIAALLAQLGPIPEACGLERIFGSVRGADYEDLVPNEPMLRLIASPYMMAMQPCLIKTMEYVPADESVLFTFERQDRYSPLSHLPEEAHGSRVVMAYVPKDATARTQPADYLAYEMAQCELDRNSVRAKAGESILGDSMMVGARVSRAQIRSIVEYATMSLGG